MNQITCLMRGRVVGGAMIGEGSSGEEEGGGDDRGLEDVNYSTVYNTVLMPPKYKPRVISYESIRRMDDFDIKLYLHVCSLLSCLID